MGFQRRNNLPCTVCLQVLHRLLRKDGRARTGDEGEEYALRGLPGDPSRTCYGAILPHVRGSVVAAAGMMKLEWQHH